MSELRLAGSGDEAPPLESTACQTQTAWWNLDVLRDGQVK
jgi:hypothetical protein